MMNKAMRTLLLYHLRRAIDGTHVKVVVPNKMVVQHTGRSGSTSQNVLAICDFDMKFTFVCAGWPGSAHDMRVLTEAMNKYAHKFPFPPEGKFYLVDSGYPNRPGFLAPYRGTKYHVPEFRDGPAAKGLKETFNHAHSQLRNVIERAFELLKMKWRILLDLPSYPMRKQSKIITACMAVQNFIRQSALPDIDFDLSDTHDNIVLMARASTSQASTQYRTVGDEDRDMNAFHDQIAQGLYSRS